MAQDDESDDQEKGTELKKDDSGKNRELCNLNEARDKPLDELSDELSVQMAEIDHLRWRCQSGRQFVEQTNGHSFLLDLIEAINKDERILSLLLKPRLENKDSRPVCVSEARRLERLKGLLNQARQFMLDETEGEQANESRRDELNSRQLQDAGRPTSISRLSIDTMAASNSSKLRLVPGGSQAQISRRVWRQSKLKADTRNLSSISLASGLDQRKSSDSSGFVAGNYKRQRTGKFDTASKQRSSTMNQSEDQFVASRYGNKETLL